MFLGRATCYPQNNHHLADFDTRKKALTDLEVRKAKPRAAPYKIKDARGLHIEIRPIGTKLWRYRYRFAGKETMLSLGEYPDVSLDDAREARDKARKMVKAGVHPAQQRKLETIQRQYEGANTFAVIAVEWLDKNKSHWSPRTYAQRKRLLEREVFPVIGALPIRQVQANPALVLSILQSLEKRAPSFATIAQQAISSTFRHAIATLRAESDPIPALRSAIKIPQTKHKTPLTEAEIPDFFKALETYEGSYQTKAAVRLLWWTWARTNELLKAKWIEFNYDKAEWRIPGQRMKKRTVTDHIVPLVPQALEQLKSLQLITGNSEFLFPNRKSLRKPASDGLVWKAFDSMSYTGKFAPHGIRTTGSTILNEQGFNGDWIERQLAHHDRNETRATYNGAKYLESRRAMMIHWANYIEGLCSGAKVTPIRKAN